MTKQIMMVLSTIGMVSFLAGCASSNSGGWYQKGYSREDTRTALSRCIYNVEMNKVSPAREKRLIAACMQKEGFRYRRN